MKDNTPVLVEWLDWGGHWQVIIGYDTMGTEILGDDVRELEIANVPFINAVTPARC